jgi:K+/H+ antiporter YhaU regulatory subunit KhtT
MKLKLGKGLIEKKDIGGTINQLVPAVGLQYIATAPDIADVQSVAALEQARQAAQQKVDAARAAAIPDDKSAQDFFKSAEGLSGEVNSIQQEYNQERNNFYQKVLEDPDYGLSPQGKQHLRKIGSIVSMERINALRNNKETFEQDRKKVNEKGTGDDIFYDNGFVHIENPKTGETIKVDASDYNAQRNNPSSQLYGARALTINENFNRINSRVANTKGNLPAMSSQLAYQDAVKELEKYFEDIGGTSSETVRDSFGHMGVTTSGENIPGISTMASKTGGNTRQLAAAVALAGSNLSVGARNAFAAELLRRGVDPKQTQKYINDLASGEAAKRVESERSSKQQFSPMLGAIDTPKSGSEAGDFLGFTPAVEVNSSFAGDADKSWINFWDNKNVNGVVIERNDSFPISQGAKKSVSVNGDMLYKIGGDDDSPNNGGKMVRSSVLTNVVESRPIATFVFTGNELTQDGKQKRDANESGKMLLTGDKGTIGVKSMADLQRKPGPNGEEYVYDPDKEVWREVTRRGFRVYEGLDDDQKPKGEKYFVPMTLGESRVIMGKQDRSGQLANITFVTKNGMNQQGTQAMRWLQQKAGEAVRNKDAFAANALTQQYKVVEGLYNTAMNPNVSAEQRGKAIANLNKVISGIYYDAAGDSFIKNVPAIKPAATPQSINTLEAYQ